MFSGCISLSDIKSLKELGCFIVTKEGKIYMLEVNTTPGMTPTSFIPQQVKAAGLTMTEVLTDIVENQF